MWRSKLFSGRSPAAPASLQGRDWAVISRRSVRRQCHEVMAQMPIPRPFSSPDSRSFSSPRGHGGNLTLQQQVSRKDPLDAGVPEPDERRGVCALASALRPSSGTLAAMPVHSRHNRSSVRTLLAGHSESNLRIHPDDQPAAGVATRCLHP